MDWCLARLRRGRRLSRGRAQRAKKRVQCERSERAHAVFGSPAAIGRAEQRSGDRIRAGACLSVASLRPTPGGASSARHPAGARPLARLSFAYLFFGEAKKSKAGGRPNLRTKTPSLCLLSFGEAKESNSAYRPKPDLKTMHCKYCTYGSPRRCAPRDDQALQAFLLITFLWPSKEK